MKANVMNWHGWARQSLSGYLSVGVVYEDSNAHQQATAVCEFLVRLLGESCEITATWWRTSLLSDPKLSRVAARAVAHSDLILISLRCQQQPAPAFKSWLESWPLPGKGDPQLMVLLHRSMNGPAVTQWNVCLGDLAGRRNMDYLVGTAASFTESPILPFGENAELFMPEHNQRVEPYLHWGLNE